MSLNRFFISEQFHRTVCPGGCIICNIVSIASSSANSFTAWTQFWSCTQSRTVSIASSSANSFTGWHHFGYYAEQQEVSIASSSANSFTGIVRPNLVPAEVMQGLNRFFISEQFHRFRRRRRDVSLDGCLNRFFISELFHRYCTGDYATVSTGLNRFFISEQFHSTQKQWTGCVTSSVSIASSSANSFTVHQTDAVRSRGCQSQSLLHQRTVSQTIYAGRTDGVVDVSIASSSANSFTETATFGSPGCSSLSQSLLHQRTVSQSKPDRSHSGCRIVSIASSSANSFTARPSTEGTV